MSYDGKPFFCADHGNYATGTASAINGACNGLDSAIEAIGNQSAPDPESAIPIPCGTWGKYLITPPSLLAKAKRLARVMLLDKQGDNLEVRQEPRLTLGVVDPQTGDEILGSTTSWLLASPATIVPSVIVGGLNGPPRPQLRRFDLAGPGEYAGQWGVGWDIVSDVGAVLLDPRGIYWSAGA
jgi:hypothetical protein